MTRKYVKSGKYSKRNLAGDRARIEDPVCPGTQHIKLIRETLTAIIAPVFPSCPRCGLDHTNMVFLPFMNPIDVGQVYDHYGYCPVTREPIILDSKCPISNYPSGTNALCKRTRTRKQHYPAGLDAEGSHKYRQIAEDILSEMESGMLKSRR